MRVLPDARTVELTRRNLLALLAKLDGHPPDSACSIEREGWTVRAVEDDVHYSDRPAGRMHHETEHKLHDGGRRCPCHESADDCSANCRWPECL